MSRDILQGTEGRIGYIVDPAFAGRGAATAGCNADNHASVRVLEKAGMRREQLGVQDSWHAELGWVDGYEYAVLAHEWRGRLAQVSWVGEVERA